MEMSYARDDTYRH